MPHSRQARLMLPLVVQLGIVLSAAMLPVSAVSANHYNGHQCIKTSFGPVTYTQGMIRNPSPVYWMTVECPVNTDDTIGIGHGYVQWVNHSTEGPITCTLTNASGSAPTLTAAPTINSSRRGVSESVRSEGVRGGSGARIYFSCTIPPTGVTGRISSGIESYTAVEVSAF